MAREAILEINCSRYSNKIIDVITLLNKVGWKYCDEEKNVEYLPVGDNDDYNWQKKAISERQLQELIDEKQGNSERVGINLYYQCSGVGVTLLAKNTEEIIFDLCFNRKTVDKTRESITNVGWYFDNIVQKLREEKCPIDYIKFEDYMD